MEFKKFGNKFIIRLDKGEELVTTIKDFCQKQNIFLGWIQGIGAVNRATIGLFETASKKYHSTELNGDYEITNLSGNISSMNNDVYLHLHVNLSDNKHQTYGGHLNSAVISATGELYIEVIEGSVERKFSDEIGLNLYQFN